jgi:hypothetical protein
MKTLKTKLNLKMKKIIFTLSTLLLISSCGIKHTPILNTSNISEINFPADVNKKSKSCAYGLGSMAPFTGSTSVIEAAKKSGFKKVTATDIENKFYLIFNKTCAVVYGR